MASSSQKPMNPFFTGIVIPNDYFCDRKSETEMLIEYINNSVNVVLKSPRRIGKSSLIMHFFNQEEIAKNYNTLFVDIYGTKSMADFLHEFQNAFINAPFAKTEKGRKGIMDLFQRIYFQVNFNPEGTLGSARIGISPTQGYSITLSEMFSYLEKTQKPNIVVFDEFQKIKEYPEDAAAILRSYVQRMNNTHFIFSGSSRHMLDKMFENSNEPFYRSAKSMDLKPISQDVYISFAKGLFLSYGKNIDDAAIDLVYWLFSGNTYDMQEVMKETFMKTTTSESVTPEKVTGFIIDILEQRDYEFRDRLDKIDSEKARRLLYCIANEGIATGITSSAMIKQYNLDNASSVQNAIKYLGDDKRNIITKVGKNGFMLQNRFFELWLAKHSGSFQHKIETAKERFEKESSR